MGSDRGVQAPPDTQQVLSAAPETSAACSLEISRTARLETASQRV
jgi:hypothetical protein